MHSSRILSFRHNLDGPYWCRLFLQIISDHEDSPDEKTKSKNFSRKIEILQDLAIGELAEFHAALSFMLVLIGASYGPDFCYGLD